MPKYLEHLNKLKKISVSKKEELKSNLTESFPGKEWPRTMPASVDPKLILIGVSPGGSQNEDIIEDKFKSKPSILKDEDSNFFYPDRKHYWKKLRILATKFFESFEPIEKLEALSLTSHFNLGTKRSGNASKDDVEEHIIHWVSKLLNKTHKPDLVVLFGLTNILQDREIYNYWNHKEGLQVNWFMPTKVPFKGYGKQNLTFKEWKVENSLNHNFKVVLWPNHPSQPPFGNIDIWETSVNEYISHFKDS